MDAKPCVYIQWNYVKRNFILHLHSRQGNIESIIYIVVLVLYFLFPKWL